MNKSRSSYKWMSVAAAGLLAVALAGCNSGGGGGGDTTAAPPPAGGGTPTVAVPTGTAPITLTSATPAATFAALVPVVKVGGVSINSAPQVSFSIADANDNPIIGWGSTSKSATATVANYPNLGFTLAKLVPGTNGSPSKWVSYIVTSVPTTTAAATGQRPNTESHGTLVDNKNGTYTYTFYRDITKVKDQVAAMTLTAPNSAADLGDLTYDPNLVHRLAIQVSGNAPGTGTNTPNAVQVTPGVPLKKPVDAIYDFIPATGKAVTATDFSRDIVATAKCLECHAVLGGIPGDTGADSGAAFHGGSRNETKYCVTCHTEQRKYGRTEATLAADGRTYTSDTNRTDDMAIANFPRYIHKIHFGEQLYKQNYNFAGVKFNEIKFPQDHRNCTKCHDGSDTSTAKTKDGNSWQKTPNRLACGACHDGISFITGKGKARGSDYPGHIGGAQPDDSKCALCHDANSINAVYHLPVTPPSEESALHVTGGNANTNAAWIASNPARRPAGAIAVTYDIQSVSLNASRNPVMVFRLLQDGVAKAFNTPSATKTEIYDNFMGAPSVYFAFAVPQDGVTAPADFNASISSYLKTLWNGTSSGGGKGTLTGPDASGYYTATITGSTVPAGAVMLTGGLGYSYNVSTTLPLTQTNLADYPVTPAKATGQTNQIGGLILIAPNVTKVATGFTGRRVIVEDARCNKCHQELGAFTSEAFHAGQRNDAPTCSWCHTPNRTSSGWSADSTYYIHAIHAGKKRTNPFTWHASTTTESFANIEFPGILKNCEACHVPGGYDFSNADTSAAIPNRLYRTAATGIFNGTAGTTTPSYSGTNCSTVTQTAATALSVFSLSPFVVKDGTTNYGAGFSYNASGTAATICKPDGTAVSIPPGGTFQAEATTLVNSPIAAACSACHDTSLALQHMESNGGSIYRPRSTALAKQEQCTLCHTSGKVADIKLMHAINK